MNFSIINDEKNDYHETKNILEYSLFLDLANRNNSEVGEEIIHGIFAETNQICKEFSIPEDIFGTNAIIEPENRSKYDEKVISLILRNHCIISSLYTAKSLLLDKTNTDISPYRIAKYFCDKGYYELSNIYNMKAANAKNNEKVKIELKEKGNKEQLITSIFDTIGYNIGPNNFLQSANKYKEQISSDNYTKKVIAHSYGRSGITNKEYYSSFINSDLYYNTVRFSGLLNKRLDSLKPKEHVIVNDAVDFNRVLLDFVKNMRDSSDYVKNNKSDKLLYKYQLERYYPYLLIHELVRNHNKVSKQYAISGDIYNLIMSKFNMLPNAFSRRYFINWAYNSIEYTHLHENYWSHMKENNKTVVGLLNDTTFDTADRIHTWMTLVNDFQYYASYITFPVYEKTFFLKLYEFYENKTPGNALDSMVEALTNYIDKYYDFLTYDFGDGELMDRFITYKIARIKPCEYDYDGSVGTDAANEAYIKYFIKDYHECNFTDVKEEKLVQKKSENINATLINPLQKPMGIVSYDSARFFYEIARNIFSLSNLEDYYNRSFNKEYFRIPRSKSFDIGKVGIEHNDKNLPIYNRNFAFNQINEIMKIQKYAEINNNIY